MGPDRPGSDLHPHEQDGGRFPNRKDETRLWMGISFPIQEIVRHPESCIPKRPSLRSSERGGALSTCRKNWGPLGIRMEGLSGHAAIAVGVRIKLGTDEEFYP